MRSARGGVTPTPDAERTHPVPASKTPSIDRQAPCRSYWSCALNNLMQSMVIDAVAVIIGHIAALRCEFFWLGPDKSIGSLERKFFDAQRI